MMAIQTAILSEPGGRESNEDACGYLNREGRFCAVVADGAGGHEGGQVASRLAVRTLLSRFSEDPAGGAAALNDLVRDTNRAVLDGRASSPDLAQMYTTIVAVAVDLRGASMSWAHCGDSRLYWFHEGRLIERTRDHSLVQSLVDAGVLQDDELRGHPKRSTLQSALGMEEEELALASPPAPRPVAGANVLLLCSDGVWEHIPDAMLEDLLRQSSTPDEWLAGIGVAVTEATRSAKSHDNYTALAVWLHEVPPLD
jgi:serine/threonine protein phosphatase PrpC